MCVARLRNRVAVGFGDLEPANPAPIAGCITNHGATIVPSPTASAGPIDGQVQALVKGATDGVSAGRGVQAVADELRTTGRSYYR